MMDEKALLEQWDMLIRCAISGKSRPNNLAVDLTDDSRNFLLSIAAETRAMLEFQSRKNPIALDPLPVESEAPTQWTATSIE